MIEFATPAVLGYLFFNRMQGIAYDVLKKNGLLGKVNREFRNSLGAAYEQNVLKNDSFKKCIVMLSEILSPCTCKVAMLKGAYLCAHYPDGYRTSNDADLLILPKDVTAVDHLLSSAGFKQGNVRNGEFIPATRQEIIESKMMRGETVSYIKKVNLPFMKFFEVDINFSLDYNNGTVDTLSDMLSNVCIKNELGFSVPTLDDADFFIHLCAMLSEKNILTNVSDIADYFTMDKSDTILIARPLYHCAVLTGEFLTAIVRGANIRFYSEQFNPTVMLELIKEHGITAFCGTPTLLSVMARFNRSNATATLHHICISGECMSAEVGRKIRAAFPACRIYHIYGLTEACPRVSYLPPEHFGDYPDCVGIPLKSVSIHILNEQGDFCHTNEEGILYVKGDNVMIGYYREPEKTSKVLKNGWLCTGDIAVINDVGFLKIKGRNDDLIIKSGMNVYPAEIEGTIKQDSRVREVLVYEFRNSFGTQIGMKLVGEFSSTEEVKQLCMKILPSFQVPSVIELVDELPKNGSGKIIRRKML